MGGGARLRRREPFIAAALFLTSSLGFVCFRGITLLGIGTTPLRGLGRRTSFKLAARVYRSGGLAKDAIYLRGFFRVMEYVAEGGDLEPYWLGKIAPVHIPVVEKLFAKDYLKRPRLIPEFLSRDDAKARIADYIAAPSPEKWLSPEPPTESAAS